MFRNFTLAILFALASLAVSAQHRFDPEQFERRLEEQVIQKAEISPAEQTRFLPIFREKRRKEVEIMSQMRQERNNRNLSEKEMERAIKKRDNAELELKKLQQTYHNKMLAVIPASKVMAVIRAEEDFHREQMAKMEEFRRNRSQGDNEHRGPRHNQNQRPNQRPQAGRR